MDKEQQQKKGRAFVISGVAGLILGGLLMAMVGPQKDTWEYYLSSSHRSAVDMGVMLSWILIIWSAVELVCGLVIMSSGNAQPAVQEPEKQPEENIEWIEGEIVNRDWDPDHHQVEWITVRQKNGVSVRLWHYISDDKVYRVGDCGLVRAKDRLITEFISSEHVM